VASWDRRSAGETLSMQRSLLASQLRDTIGPFSPFWREQLSSLDVRPAALRDPADLAKLPAVGERDLCTDGDPLGMARLVIQADEVGWGLHEKGPALRKGIVERLVSPEQYRRRVAAAIRPVSYHLAGLGLRYPVASTRSDLDLMARAGARAWAVLGLTPGDVLVSALDPGPSLVTTALFYAALGAGAPALHVGATASELLSVVPATVLAVRDAEALDDLVAAVAPGRAVLRIWGPDDGRVLYAECRQGGASAGLHTYPDLEVLETVDVLTGERGPATLGQAGELVVTQLGFRGSALLRWRTGAVLPSAPRTEPCPACGRTVPRLPSALVPDGAVPALALLDGVARVDLRAAAAALDGRPDLSGWLIEIRRAARSGRAQFLVHVAPRQGADVAAACIAAATDIASVSGVMPTQLLVDDGLAGGGRLSIDPAALS
jgi:hypothetical protein